MADLRLSLPSELDVAPRIIESASEYRSLIESAASEAGARIAGNIDLISQAAALAGPSGAGIAIAALSSVGSFFKSLFGSYEPPPPPMAGGEELARFDDPLATVYRATISGKIVAGDIDTDLSPIADVQGPLNGALRRLDEGMSWPGVDAYLRDNKASMRALGAFCFYAGFKTLFNRDIIAQEKRAAQVGRILGYYAPRFQLVELFANYWLYRQVVAVNAGLNGNCNARIPGFGRVGNSQPFGFDRNFKPGYTLGRTGAHKALQKVCQKAGTPTLEGAVFQLMAPYPNEDAGGHWVYTPIPTSVFESEIGQGRLDGFDYWLGHRFRVTFGKDRSDDAPSNMPETAREVPRRCWQMVRNEPAYYDEYKALLVDMKEALTRAHAVSIMKGAVKRARGKLAFKAKLDKLAKLKKAKEAKTARRVALGAGAALAYFLIRR